MIENIDILKEVAVELARFQKKLDAAIVEQSGEKNHYGYRSRKAYTASKRAALDFKTELTKLTQDSKYKYKKYKEFHAVK